MEILLGLVMYYCWIHGTVIIFKKLKDTTSYENAVLIGGLVGFVLYLIGTMNS